MPLLNTSGQISLLRVHDRGTKYGPPSDQIDVEVVIQFAGRPDFAFGFQLRNDPDGPAREGMLGLLRDAFTHGWIAHVDYEIASTALKNSRIRRVWITKPAAPQPPGGGGLVGSARTTTRKAKAAASAGVRRTARATVKKTR